MKKRFAVPTMVLFALSLAAVALAATVKYDYDREVNFTSWTTAAWRGPQDPGASMVERRLEKAIEGGFRDRGYAFVADPGQADFVIAYEAGAWQERSLQESPGGPVFGRSLYVNRENRGALVVKVYERATGRLAWHGVVADALASDPNQADKKTAKAVAALLKKFPARGGGK